MKKTSVRFWSWVISLWESISWVWTFFLSLIGFKILIILSIKNLIIIDFRCLFNPHPLQCSPPSIFLILIFLYMWKSEDSWLEFEKLGKDSFVFVLKYFFAVYLLYLYIEFSRHFDGVKIFQTMCLFSLINIFVFLRWVILVHQEVANAHEQKFYDKKMSI